MFGFLGKKLKGIFKKKIDECQLDELEALFYEADLGAEVSSELIGKVRTLVRKNVASDSILDEIKKELSESLKLLPSPTTTGGHPHVVLVVGVNGNGKTTTVAKLASHYTMQGKSVLIAAADTFRAAAIDQLELWAQRLNVDIVKGVPGSDPAAVAFDAIEAAKNRGHDVVIVDTAGRLHTKKDLMQELQKIHRVSGKALEGAPHETLLVLDATIGQNGVEQAAIFHDFTPLTGIILTKLDGTAKGGTAIALQRRVKLPIRFIGTGEGLKDLHTFEPTSFVNALFE